MEKINFVVGRNSGKMQHLFKEYFYNEIMKGVDELPNYINCNLERFLMYDDIIELIDRILKVGE